MSQVPIASFELEETTVAELQLAVESGQRTSRSIVEAYLRRIDELDRVGPELGAIIEVNPDALHLADELDEERAASGARGPLHGIPVVIKDNIDTCDAMTTTAGSLALEGSTPARDSFIVERLRKAGAVLLAKANMSEWANFRGERSTSGWSARGGQCRNPYALDRNPSGSSSGSAVAVSANLAAVSIGTETDGSIMSPSSANGIVGIKPTVGLVSRSGIVPISHSQDTAGPMCRTVEDAAVLLGALTGIDERDPLTSASGAHAHADYRPFLDPGGLDRARIGVARNFGGFDARVQDLFEAAVRDMEAAGAVIVDPVDLGSSSWDHGLALRVLEYEFKSSLDAYLQGLGPNAPVRSLADVIEFNERNAERELPHFGQQRMHAAESRGPLTDRDYLDAIETIQRANRADGIDAVMETHQLDAIVAPTGDVAWLTDHIRGDRPGASSTSPAAIAGYPDITVPMGFVRGLPVGVSFFARAWSEPTLIRIAYAYEQSTRHRRQPTFADTLG